MRNRWIATVLGIALALAGATAAAQSPPVPPTPLRVIAFDGGWNLPVWAAQRQGFFEANGVAVQLAYTPNSAVPGHVAVRRHASTSRWR